ncbi:hypothetical protein Tsp_13876, partial [Trichinella spiralis]|uniref:hypothetical protein n=1 Tax=Trichinella spiralis TaxID=6334 RepID=UPI0001EFDC8C
IVIRYSCMMLHPSSIRFITFIVLRRQISKKRVEAVDMRGNKDQSECSEFEVMTIEIIFVAVLLYAAASVATLKPANRLDNERYAFSKIINKSKQAQKITP